MKGRTDGRTYVDDVMAIKPNFLTSMGYYIFLNMVLRARGAPLKLCDFISSNFRTLLERSIRSSNVKFGLPLQKHRNFAKKILATL